MLYSCENIRGADFNVPSMYSMSDAARSSMLSAVAKTIISSSWCITKFSPDAVVLRSCFQTIIWIKSKINTRQTSIQVKDQYKSKINTCQTSIQVKDQYTSNISTSQRSIHVKHKYKSKINTRQSFLCKTYLYNLYVARLVYRLTVCSKSVYMRELVYYIYLLGRYTNMLSIIKPV